MHGKHPRMCTLQHRSGYDIQIKSLERMGSGCARLLAQAGRRATVTPRYRFGETRILIATFLVGFVASCHIGKGNPCRRVLVGDRELCIVCSHQQSSGLNLVTWTLLTALLQLQRMAMILLNAHCQLLLWTSQGHMQLWHICKIAAGG